QAKLLRVLETGEIVRLGSNETRKTDVRFVSATNRDLRALSSQGKFRDDLYFRIRGAEIHVPPLRDRREDIRPLVMHALGQFAAELGRAIPNISDPAMMRLMNYNWPGNVRELFNVVHEMLVRCEGDTIDVRHVPEETRQREGDEQLGGSLAGVGLDRLEKEAIRQ